MDENKPQVSYANNLATLADILDEVKRPGDFFAAGSMETPMPLLKVKGAGTVPFPVPAEQSRKLIKSVAERAPYGRGDQTLHDESVRKVWQIAAGKVRLSGKASTATLKSLLARVETALGRPAGSVKAELYKLLIYDKGGFFKAHRDTEKSRGMFGTLVVSLPSAHSRGATWARVLRDAAQAAECAFHLGMFHIEESGWAEYTGGFHGYGRSRKMRYWENALLGGR